MKKIYLTILIGILLVLLFLPMIISQEYLPHQQRTALELLISSNNATDCNWSYIQYPDNTKSLVNLEMTKTENDFNYTIDYNNFTRLGTTCMGITCWDGVSYEIGSVCREVTPSGFGDTYGFYILILGISAVIILSGFYLEDAPMVILGSLGLYFIGLYILFFGIVGMKDTVYTWAIGIIVLMLAAYISVKSAWELIVD